LIRTKGLSNPLPRRNYYGADYLTAILLITTLCVSVDGLAAIHTVTNTNKTKGETKMKNKTLWNFKYGILALAITFASSQVMVNAQYPPVEPEGKGIEGTWDHEVTIRICATGNAIAHVSTMSTYGQGGVISEISGGQTPAVRSPGLGVWNHVRGREYAEALRFYRFNPDGTRAGKTVIVSNFTHLLDDTLDYVSIVKNYDAAGNLVQTLCATTTSTRFTGDA
jgi:hypothetical protein